MKTRISIWWLVVLAVVLFALMKQCEGEPKTVTKTVTKVIPVTETITEVKIDTIYTRVYVEKVKTIKGNDSIVYKDKPSETTIDANKYETTLKSNKAIADLKITTTGELLDVQGSITYPEKETTTTITKTRDASGLFIYGQMPISSQLTSPEVGLMFQVKNKLIIGAGVQYSNFNNNVNGVITLAIKL